MKKVILVFAILVALCQQSDAQTHMVMILIDFPSSNPPANGDQMAFARDIASGADIFVFDNSYGLSPQQIDVFGIYRVDDAPILSAPSPAYRAVAAASQEAALANGIDLYLYGWDGTLGDACHCIYISPQINGVAGGYADLSGVWIAGLPTEVRAPNPMVLNHELGHHTGTSWEQEGLDCSDQSPIGGARGVTCTSVRYQDSIDVMGKGSGQFNAIEKCRRGWLPCPAPVGFGDYLISPFEQATGTRSLVVDIGKRGGWLMTLEYRQPIGTDAGLTLVNQANVYHGVIAHIGDAPTKLLRLHPDDPTWSSATFNTPALPVGQTVCFSDARKSVTVLSADANGALIRVDHCH